MKADFQVCGNPGGGSTIMHTLLNDKINPRLKTVLQKRSTFYLENNKQTDPWILSMFFGGTQFNALL